MLDVDNDSALSTELIKSAIKQHSGLFRGSKHAQREKLTGLLEEFKDVLRYGVSGGFSGFIYYVETEDFYNRNEDDIEDYLNELADALCHQSSLAMIGGSTIQQYKNNATWCIVEQIANDIADNNIKLRII